MVCLQIIWGFERASNALVNESHFFITLNQHSAPVEAFIEALRLRLKAQIVMVKALTQVTNESEEEVSFILVLLSHQFVKTLFSQCLHQDLTPSHFDALLL